MDKMHEEAGGAEMMGWKAVVWVRRDTSRVAEHGC